MTFTDEQRRQVIELVQTELERRSLSPEPDPEDIKRRLLGILEEADDPATFVGTRVHDWLARNLEILRPRTEHQVTRLIRAAGRIFVHHGRIVLVMGLAILLVTAAFTQINRFLFHWNEDEIIERLVRNIQTQGVYNEAIAARTSEADKMLGNIEGIHAIIQRKEPIIDDYMARVNELRGNFQHLSQLEEELQQTADTLRLQAENAATEAVNSAQPQANQLAGELYGIFAQFSENQRCTNTSNSLCVESETCPQGTNSYAAVELVSTDQNELASFRICARSETENSSQGDQ